MAIPPHQYYHFCPRCGAPLELAQVDHQERLRCTKCGYVFFQNPAAAVAAVVLNDRHEVLLVRRAIEPAKGTWDVPGGFVDWGEDPETAITREMREELGVDFLLNRPPFTNVHGWYETQGLQISVNIMYYTGRITGTMKAADDIDAFRWFARTSLPENIGFDHVRQSLMLLP